MFFIFQRNLDELKKIKTKEDAEAFIQALQLLTANIFSVGKRWLMYLLLIVVPFLLGFYTYDYFI